MLVVAALGVGAVIVRPWQAASVPAVPPTTVVTRGDVTQIVSATGNLAPTLQLGLDFIDGGRLTERDRPCR